MKKRIASAVDEAKEMIREHDGVPGAAAKAAKEDAEQLLYRNRNNRYTVQIARSERASKL